MTIIIIILIHTHKLTQYSPLSSEVLTCSCRQLLLSRTKSCFKAVLMQSGTPHICTTSKLCWCNQVLHTFAPRQSYVDAIRYSTHLHHVKAMLMQSGTPHICTTSKLCWCNQVLHASTLCLMYSIASFVCRTQLRRRCVDGMASRTLHASTQGSLFKTTNMISCTRICGLCIDAMTSGTNTYPRKGLLLENRRFSVSHTIQRAGNLYINRTKSEHNSSYVRVHTRHQTTKNGSLGAYTRGK